MIFVVRKHFAAINMVQAPSKAAPASEAQLVWMVTLTLMKDFRVVSLPLVHANLQARTSWFVP